ncbi:MAG: TonB-dependent receptor [Bacteroidales bacterium]|nr:TonB-dependent receptor [Bacteroidales bacterium]
MKNLLSLLMLIILINIIVKPQVKAENPEGKIVVTGKLVDKETNQPIEFASVAIYLQKDSSLITGGLTSATGTFEIEVSKPGTYYIVANFMGYETVTINNITLSDGAKKNLGVIKMGTDSKELEEVVVSAQRNHIDYKIDRKVINISTDIAADGANVAEALENVPSVDVDIDGNVTLRGSSDFQVLIDGKPSSLSADEILKQTPAALLENIEIITNASAKYDAEGSSGIINLVTKKNLIQGINGAINLTVGSQERYGGDFMFNMRRKKINYFISGSYNTRGNYFESNNNTITYGKGYDKYINQDQNHETHFGGGNFRTGIDYYPNDNNVISFGVGAGLFDNNSDGNNHYKNWYQLDGSDQMDTLVYVKSDNDSENDTKFYQGTLSYQHNFAGQGHKLNFNAFYSMNDRDGNDDFIQKTAYNMDMTGEMKNTGHKTETVTEGMRTRLNLDYTLPLANEQKFEAGVQAEFTKNETDYDYFDLEDKGFTLDQNINNNYFPNQDFTYDLTFKQNISAFYSTFATHFLGFGVQLGFRGEYTYRLMTANGIDYKMNRFDAFPSIHISKNIKETNSFQMGYSRRIRRPWENNLNPCPAYSDEYTRRVGNPDLKPEYTDLMEVNYQLNYNKWFIALETFYRHTGGRTENVSTLGANDIIISRFENLSTNNNFGAEITLNINPWKWFTSNTNVSLRQYYINGNYNGVDMNRDGNSWNIRQRFSFNPTKTTKIQVNMRYRGADKSLLSSNKGNFTTGLSVRQSLCHRRLALSLNVRDIFKTQNSESTTETDTYWMYSKRYRKAPMWTIGVNFKINNYKERNMPEGEEGGGDSDHDSDFGGGEGGGMDF